jgi:hypothetical protein
MAFFRGNVGRDASREFNNIFNPEFAVPSVLSALTRVDRGFSIGPALVFEDFSNPTGFNTYGESNDMINVTVIHGADVVPNHNSMDADGRTNGLTAALITWETKGASFQTN